MVLVGYAMGAKPEQYENAINSKTAAIAWTESYHSAVGRGHALDIKKIINLAHKYDLPFFVDSASILPPRSYIHRFADIGADLTIFSGGKAIEGPNDTGLILAGTDLGVELIDARAGTFYVILAPPSKAKQRVLDQKKPL